MNQLPVHRLLPERLLQSTVFYLVITDRDGKCLYENPLFKDHFLPVHSESTQHFLADTIYPDDLITFQKTIQSCKQSPDKVFPVTVRNSGNIEQWIRWEISAFTNTGKEPEGFICIGHNDQQGSANSTDAMDAVNILSSLDDEKIRSLVSHIPGAIYRCRGDAAFSLEFFSDEVERLTGYSLDYFYQNRETGYSALVHPDDKLRLHTAIHTAVAEKEKFEIEYRIIHKNGQVRWVFESGQGIYDETEKISYVDGCIFNITNRKRTEAALAKSEDEVKRLALVAHNTINSVMITDADENITWINAGYTRISGYTLEEIRGKKIGYSLTGPDVDPDLHRRIRIALNSKLPYRGEFLSYTKNGDAIWLEVDCQPLKDEQGNHLGFMAIETDITHRKQTLKKQEELLQRLSLATDSAEIGIFEIDLSTNKVIWDDRMYQLYGCEKDKNINLYKVFSKAVHPDDAKMMENIIGELLSQKKEINGAVYRIILPDGSVRYIESHAIIKKSESGRIVSLIGTNRDVTEDVLVQEKIKTQNKVLREIAFIQSHEVRRPVANILGIIEVLQNSGALKGLEIFDHLVESAKELDQQIRAIVNKANNMDDDVFR